MRLSAIAPRSDKRSIVRGLRDLADEDLIQLAERGDEDAFEVIYDRHAVAAYSLAYRMMGSSAAAQDVVQDAFLSLWRSGSRHDVSRGSVRTWILAVVHHRAIDALRRATRHDSRVVDDEGIGERLAADERTDVAAADREQAREVRQALQALPIDQRRVITLAYFGGFTHTEIAAILDAPIGTVKGRMRLGLEKLRGQLVNFAEETS
jgi:RNA polymerase sigma-70 factor (ECF subfamily)